MFGLSRPADGAQYDLPSSFTFPSRRLQPPGSPRQRATFPKPPTTKRPASSSSSSSSSHRGQHSRTLSLETLLALLPTSARAQRQLVRLVILVVGLVMLTYVVAQRGLAARFGIPPSSTAAPSWHGLAWPQALVPRNGQGSAVGYPVSRVMDQEDQTRAPGPRAISSPTHKRVFSAPALKPSRQVTTSGSSRARDAGAPLTPSQELAALLHFLVANSGAALPLVASYDPEKTALAPEWVLDFALEPVGPRRESQLKVFEREVYGPGGVGRMVVLGRKGAVWMKEVERMLRVDYRIAEGEIAFVDLEGRIDSDVLRPLLVRLLATDSLSPHVILGGTSIGGYAELQVLHEQGKLAPLLERSGVAMLPPVEPKKKRLIKGPK